MLPGADQKMLILQARLIWADVRHTANGVHPAKNKVLLLLLLLLCRKMTDYDADLPGTRGADM